MAQDYKEGELLTTTDQVVGKKVLLWAPGGIATDHPAGYMCGTKQLTETLTNDCVVEFVPVQGEVDGNKLYALKQVSTGLYYMDPKFATEDSETAVLTKNLDEAFKMTVLPYEDHTAEEGLVPGRNTAVTGNLQSDGSTIDKQNLDREGFILTRDAVYDDSDPDIAGQVMYLASFYSPVYSPYMDTNVWNIFLAEEVKGLEKVSKYVEAYFNDGIEKYPAGTTPGYYKSDVVAKASAIVDKANDLITNSTEVGDEEANAICKDLKAAYDELQTALIPLSAGYYFIHNDAGRYLSTNTTKGVEFVWTTASDYKASAPLTADDVKQIWYITPGDTTTHFNVQNLYSKSFINGATDPAVTGDGRPCYVLAKDGQIGVALEGTASAASFIFFAINADNYNDHNTQFHAKYDNAGIFNWNDKTSVNNCFHFTPVSKEEVEAVLAMAEQARRNEVLQTAYDKANGVYNSGFVFNGAPVDTLFTGNGALVTDPNQFFSNAKDPNEGSYAELLDGKFNTYFHSNWHNQNVAEVHAIGVKLDEPISTAISLKLSKRFNTNKKWCVDYPVAINIYASNDTTAATGKWDLIAENVKIDWSTARSYGETTIEDGVGYAGAGFEGSYQYFNFEVVKSSNDQKFFVLSEMNVYQGKEDKENSTISQVSEATRKLMESELDKAKKELVAEKATDETIKSLNEAYDQFVKELPVPALLADAIKAAAKLAQDAQDAEAIGDEVGFYPQAALETLNGVIEVAQAYDTKGKTAAEINAEVAKVEAGMDAFKASLKLPVADKYYVFRGMSDKLTGTVLTSYKALVYSKSNTLNGGVFFTRPVEADGGSVEDNMTDAVDFADRLEYVWYVEKAEAGKMVIRNVATGMYFAPQNGEIHQSATPFEIQMYSGKPGVFVLEAGEGTQVNAGASGAVVTWADMEDHNAWWTFEEVTGAVEPYNLYWEVNPGKLQIITLPVSVDASNVAEGFAYNLIGQTADNKLALAAVVDPIEAGTPFIFKAEENIENNAAVFTYACDGDINALNYVYEPVKVNGLKGTICEADTAVAGNAYLAGGKLVAANSNTVIGNNSGYFDGTHAKNVDASSAAEFIELGKIDITTSIDNAEVVVLPSVVDVYTINGTLVRKNVKAANALKGLPAGLYIVGGQKMIVK